MARIICLAVVLLIGCNESSGGEADAGADAPVGRVDTGPDAAVRDSAALDSAVPDSRFVTGLPVVSGGSLEVIGERVIVGDADRAMVWVFDLSDTPRVEHAIALVAGDEPGRVVALDADHAVVVLRGVGQLAYLDLATGEVTSRVDLCRAPRGVATQGGVIYAACAGGSFVTIDDTTVTRRFIERDLRDVVVSGGTLYISLFRTSEVLVLNLATLEVVERMRPPIDEAGGVANTAWRMRAAPGGGVVVLHQRSSEQEIMVERSGYSGSVRCGRGGVVEPALTFYEAGSPVELGPSVMTSLLLVDVAIHPDGDIVVASAGAGPEVRTAGVQQISAVDGGCIAGEPYIESQGIAMTAVGLVGDRAVAWQPNGGLHLLGAAGPFSTESELVPTGADLLRDVGRDLFHQGTPSMVACASCHAEGGDDGITWNFAPTRRRTQSLLGGILDTAPFHWAGDMADMSAIMQGAFVDRMQAPSPSASETLALAEWLDGLAVIETDAPIDDVAVERGAALFEGAAGCTSCHAGTRLTDNMSVDVGTDGTFQVPSLIGVSMRPPYLHDGRAASMQDAIDLHAPTTLTGEDRDALLTYLSIL